MNFLAHFYLSAQDKELLIGNFIADAVKGNSWMEFPEGLQKGIRLHRAIDFFTDTHPVVSCSRARLRDEFNHYSPVIVDVFYDHVLARNWLDYHQEQLDSFVRHVYAVLEKNAENFPERTRLMLPYMIRHNWLSSYAQIEGIHRALAGMSRRTKFDSKMEVASKALEKDYEAFKNDFTEFFPQLITHVKNFEF